MGHFFSKASLFIDKKEAAAHLILDQDFATASLQNIIYLIYLFSSIGRGLIKWFSQSFLKISKNSSIETVLVKDEPRTR